MLTNAVLPSAFGRMYAVPGAEDDRMPVRRIEAVQRLEPTDPRTETAEKAVAAERRDQRELAFQQEALKASVKAALQAIGTAAEPTRPSSVDANASSQSQPALEKPDPQLDAAIMRFMHAVFRSLAAAEGAINGEADTTSSRKGPRDPAATDEPGNGRLRLASRIEAFAARLAGAGGADDALAVAPDDSEQGTRVPSSADDDLPRTFLQAVQALRGSGTPASNRMSDAVHAQPTRGDLVQLLKRLAQAITGAPPTVAGLPTSGSLLRERA